MVLREDFLLGLLIISVFVMLLFSSLHAAVVFLAFSSCFLCFKVALGRHLRFGIITIPSLFMLAYLILISLPSLYWFLRSDSPARFVYLLAVQSVLVAFPVGMAFALAIRRRAPSLLREFLYGPPETPKIDGMFVPLVVFLFMCTLPVLAFYFLYASHVQLFEAMRGTRAIDAEAFRFAEDALPKLLQLAFEFLRRFALPFCMLYAYFLMKFGAVSWRFAFWPLFVVTLIVSSLTLDRAEPVALFVMAVLAYLLAAKYSLFELAYKPKLWGALALALIAGGLISIFQYQGAFSVQKAIQTTWHVLTSRILLSPSFMALRAFREFPELTPFLHGASVKLVGFFTSVDVVAYYPASFVGDLWRNFGFAGVLTGSVFLGFFFQYVQNVFFVKRSAAALSLYVIFLVNAVWLIFGNAFGTMSIIVFLFGLMLLHVLRLTTWSRRSAP